MAVIVIEGRQRLGNWELNFALPGRVDQQHHVGQVAARRPRRRRRQRFAVALARVRRQRGEDRRLRHRNAQRGRRAARSTAAAARSGRMSKSAGRPGRLHPRRRLAPRHAAPRIRRTAARRRRRLLGWLHEPDSAAGTRDRGIGLRRRRGNPGRPEDDARARRARHDSDLRRDGAELAGRPGLLGASAEAVRAQLESVLGDIGAQAVKTGMLASAEIVKTVVSDLARRCPRRRSSSTRSPSPSTAIRCCQSGTLEALTAELLPLATVVTPNLLEAELLTGMTITDEKDMLAAGSEAGRRAGRAGSWSRAVTCPATRSTCCSAMGASSAFPGTDRQPAYARNRVHARICHRITPGHGR